MRRAIRTLLVGGECDEKRKETMAEEKKIKILMIAGTMNLGGIENQLMHMLRYADSRQLQIDFTTTVEHPYYEEEILALGGSCIRIPSTEGKHFLRYCRSILRVNQGKRALDRVADFLLDC